MITIVITAFLFATFTTIVIVYFLTKRVEDRPARMFFFLIGALSLPTLVVAGVRTIFRRPDPVPCPEHLAQVEAEIEEERVRRFGGKRLMPPIAERWHASYLASLKKTASTVDSFIHKRASIMSARV